MLTTVENGRVVKVVGDPDHPITDGWLCGRFQHYEELVHHPDRVLHPLVRDSKTDAFRETSWEEAIALVAERFGEIRTKHGGQAILPYHYLAHMGVVATRYADRLWNRIGTSRVGMEICAMAGAEAVIRAFGRIRRDGTRAPRQDASLHRVGQEPQGYERARTRDAEGRTADSGH